jgi:hypothetical protein
MVKTLFFFGHRHLSVTQAFKDLAITFGHGLNGGMAAFLWIFLGPTKIGLKVPPFSGLSHL